MENIPKIRYQEFTNQWKKQKIGSITTSYSGGTPKSSNKDYYSGEIPFIRSGEVNSNTTELFINEEALKNSSAKLVEKGDILYALYGATSGEVSTSKINGAINQAILAIKPHEYHSPEFIVSFLKKEKDNILDKYLQGGQGNLSATIIKGLEISLPTYSEQSAIGSLFRTIDDLLADYKENVVNYKSFKASMLSKMFPKSGHTVPEIRLAGFKDEWKRIKLREIVAIEKKGKAKANMLGSQSVYLDTEYLNGGQQIMVDALSDTSPSDIIILWDGSQAGMIYYGFEGALGSTLKAYTISGNGAFVYYQLKLYQKLIFEKYRTPNIPHVVKTFLNEFEIFNTSLQEQEAIDSFFSNLDTLISSYQDKISQLEILKKKLLQDMFI